MSNQLLIQKPFNEQYTLEIESMLINAILKSKTEIRYDFTVINVAKESMECRLIKQ